jgi:hypothetical protein
MTTLATLLRDRPAIHGEAGATELLSVARRTQLRESGAQVVR